MKKIVTQRIRMQEIEYTSPSLADFKSTFTEHVNKVPEEFRDTVTVSLECEDDYDSPRACLYLDFQRPETDVEYNARIKHEQVIEQREFEEYMRLRKIFGRKFYYNAKPNTPRDSNSDMADHCGVSNGGGE